MRKEESGNFMRYKILIGLILLPVTLTAQSKSFKKVYRSYLKEQPASVSLTAFESFSNHKKYGIPADYYATKLRLRVPQTLRQLTDENNALIRAKSKFTRLSAKSIRRMAKRYHVDTIAIEDLREQIQRQIVVQVRQLGTFPALDTLETQLQRPLPILQPAIDSTISDVVQLHLTTQDYDEATLILKKYAARIKSEHYGITLQLHQQTWELFQDKYPLCQMDHYAKDYPLFFVARDCWRDSVQQLFCRGEAAAIIHFLQKTPWTALENVLMKELLDHPPNLELLSGIQLQYCEDMQQYSTLLTSFRSKSTLPDTLAALKAVKNYVARYAPRYSAHKLLEISLQYFLEKHLYYSAIVMLTDARQYFPDTLPGYCTTNFDFQRRVKSSINGKLPLLARPDQPLKKILLPAINTPQGNESNPVLSSDGQILYFCGAGRPDNPTSGQDIFVSQRVNGDWATPQAVQALSSASDEVPLSLTTDQRQLLLTVNGRLQLSFWGNGQWNAPQPLTFSGLGLVSKGFLSSDGNTIILEGSYEKPGMSSLPDQDLFVAFRESDNTWSKPFALGSDINTDEQEGTPFLSSDGQTLYFTSDGWPGLGKSDVFMAKRTSDKWTLWTRPYNLGKEINDTFPHTGFGAVSNNGREVYFTLKPSGSTRGDLWWMMIMENE